MEQSQQETSIEYNSRIKELYLSLKPTLYALAFRYTKSRSDSEDIVHQVFLKLCQEKIQLPESAKAYLLIMTKNAVLNYIRDHKKEIVVNYVNAQSEADDYSLMFESEDQISRLYKAIENLPYRQKEIAKLKCLGLSNKEIAARLNITLNTVNSHYRTIKHNLSVLLSTVSSYLLLILFNL